MTPSLPRSEEYQKRMTISGTPYQITSELDFMLEKVQRVLKNPREYTGMKLKSSNHPEGALFQDYIVGFKYADVTLWISPSRILPGEKSKMIKALREYENEYEIPLELE